MTKRDECYNGEEDNNAPHKESREPRRWPSYDLDQMLADYPKNAEKELSWGRPRGREV